MDNRIALCTELENEISKQGYSLSRFSQVSGINRGILSATLNGTPPKPMSINQLDSMNAALGKPEGWLYELFVEQCFDEQGKTNWRRVSALLIRCIELHRNVLIDRILCLLLEDISYLNHVFELAEELIVDNPSDSVMQLYECVVSNERNYQAERLAISHYRIFRYSIKRDIKQNFIAAVTFQVFCDRLPSYMQLDAWLNLSNIYYAVQEWELVNNCGNQLISITENIYSQQKHSSIDSERPFVKYVGQAYLCKAIFHQKNGNYDKAIIYTKKYSDLGWLCDLKIEDKKEIEKFKIFARGNLFGIELYRGNFNVLQEYAKFLEVHPHETIAGLLNILTTANQYNVCVDYVLKKFRPFILKNLYNDTYIKKFIVDNQYTNLCYQLALYQSKRSNHSKDLKSTLLLFEKALQKCNISLTLDYTSLLQNVIRSMP